MLNDRAQRLLKILVERYIADGQPVGSRTLSMHAGLDLSSASIRNVMVDLENMGLVCSPHTSAGRVPTARGYRVFVDNLLTIQPLEHAARLQLETELHPDSPQRIVSAASQLLADLTRFAGVVATPERASTTFRQVEFLRLSEKRVLLIFVTADGDVQNHLLLTERDYTISELAEAALFLNRHGAGRSLEAVAREVETELHYLQGHIANLMGAAIVAGQSTLGLQQSVMVTGEKNLLNSDDLSANLANLRQLFDLFEHKTELLQLLNLSREAHGVHIFIGEESGLNTLDGCSVITAPYRMNGQVVGTLGVVGPTRMAYERVIPIVDITARLVSSALSYPLEA